MKGLRDLCILDSKHSPPSPEKAKERESEGRGGQRRNWGLSRVNLKNCVCRPGQSSTASLAGGTHLR